MNQSELRAHLEQHHAESFGWTLNCCSRNRADAEDVLQTVYLKILQGRARYDGRSAFKTWLFAVIRRTAADERRRRGLRRLRLSRYAEERERSAVNEEQRSDWEQSEMLRAFQEALARLPHRQREVLHLVFYQDLSLQEAAEVMGLSLGSARTHYARGKNQLRKWLEYTERAYECRWSRPQPEATVP
jgi:RNA polymerase sigma-70 factor (ECF subfamily)